MGKAEVLTQPEAWSAYDRWFDDARISFLAEPPALDPAFREASGLRRPAPKDWADSYLAAFASVCGLTLVTFDQAFHRKSRQSIILR